MAKYRQKSKTNRGIQLKRPDTNLVKQCYQHMNACWNSLFNLSIEILLLTDKSLATYVFSFRCSCGLRCVRIIEISRNHELIYKVWVDHTK